MEALNVAREKFAAQEGIPRARALVAWSHKFRADERAKKRAPVPALPMRVLSVSMDEMRAHALPAPRAILVELGKILEGITLSAKQREIRKGASFAA